MNERSTRYIFPWKSLTYNGENSGEIKHAVTTSRLFYHYYFYYYYSTTSITTTIIIIILYKKYTHTHYQNKKRRGLSCKISARKLSYPRRRPWFVTHTDTCNHDCKLRGLWKKLFRIQDFNSVFIIQLFIIQHINTLIITGFFSYFCWQILLAINSEITKKNVAKYIVCNLCGSRKQRNLPFLKFLLLTYIHHWSQKTFVH